MGETGLYRVTLIGRPVDPRYPTNKAVLLLVPLAGLIAAAIAAIHDGDAGNIAGAGLRGLLAAFGTWALARELAPDHEYAAFISMALGLAAVLLLDAPGLLLLFNALFLVRIVNRSTGLPAKPADSMVVAALTLWSVYGVPAPLLGLVGAVAFGFDATLARPLKHQWGFAAVCLGGSAAFVYQHGLTIDFSAMYSTTVLLLVLIGLSYLFTIVLTQEPVSTGDISGERLSLARVRAGMAIGFLVPLQATLLSAEGLSVAMLIWVAIAGTATVGLRKLFVRG